MKIVGISGSNVGSKTRTAMEMRNILMQKSHY
ncbi:hypothetical protein HNP81_002457 [Peribacillus huizhouensis]|uniref:FMN reductase n=1 Tax=Peribacillus huizhouensis TaxID=1501239 RepID=A0ABR6CQ51_9BACI|nr:hypothetical protein [Peribacillus huizhouensis]